MQMQSKADHRNHSDYDFWLTSADGSCLHNLPCPMDPKLDAYIDLFSENWRQPGRTISTWTTTCGI